MSNANVQLFTEWSRREASDIDGKVAKASERERKSQTPDKKLFTIADRNAAVQLFRMKRLLPVSVCTLSLILTLPVC